MIKIFKRVTILCVALAMLIAGYAIAEDPESVVTTPTAEELGKLVFVINGPDESMPMEIKYSDFVNGKYSLSGLKPGTYTVTEKDPDQLLSDYTFNTNDSTTTITIEVTATGSASGKLVNVYEKTAETPTPTPEVTETPTPEVSETPTPEASETPTPEPSETPTPEVTETPTPEPSETPAPGTPSETKLLAKKVWDDNDNKDGNRPGSVTVRLLADGSEVASAVLSEANGWQYQFVDLPVSKDGKKISYTLNEDPVPKYTATIDGMTVTNHYIPDTTSATVRKVWNDNDNATGIRPGAIVCTLSNGTSVTLSDANGWTATVTDLPLTMNGKKVSYTWSEQTVLGYTLTGNETSGTTTVLTNTIVEEPDEPGEGKNPPTKRRGTSLLVIEDYGTALGVDVIINHTGDCFD